MHILSLYWKWKAVSRGINDLNSSRLNLNKNDVKTNLLAWKRGRKNVMRFETKPNMLFEKTASIRPCQIGTNSWALVLEWCKITVSGSLLVSDMFLYYIYSCLDFIVLRLKFYRTQMTIISIQNAAAVFLQAPVSIL